jgi:hypothetical protein
MGANALRVVLRTHAALFISFPLVMIGFQQEWWGLAALAPGWLWAPGHMKYEWMLVAIYFSLGVGCWIASTAPTPQQLLAHDLFYRFAIWGAYGAHASCMLVEAWRSSLRTDYQHLLPYGDILPLYALAASLWWAHRSALNEEK